MHQEIKQKNQNRIKNRARTIIFAEKRAFLYLPIYYHWHLSVKSGCLHCKIKWQQNRNKNANKFIKKKEEEEFTNWSMVGMMCVDLWHGVWNDVLNNWFCNNSMSMNGGSTLRYNGIESIDGISGVVNGTDWTIWLDQWVLT